MISEILTPGLMLFGEGALGRLGDVLQKVGMTRPLVVTDRFLVTTPVFAQVKAALDEAGVAFGVFSDTVPDPELPHVDAGAAAFRAGKAAAARSLAADSDSALTGKAKPG